MTVRYPTIVMDPPWSYGNTSGRHGPTYADRFMSVDDILAFSASHVAQWVPDQWGHLYLWATAPYVCAAEHIARNLGYTTKVWLVWVKDRIGMGNYYRHQHELCCFAVKGQKRLKRKNASSIFYAPVTRHSEKPQAFYDLVESCSYGPYLDVFARRRRAGWAVYGDEVEESYQLRLEGNNESERLAHKSEIR